MEYKDKLLTTSVKPPAGFYGKGAVVDFRIPASFSGLQGTEQLFQNNVQLYYGLLTIQYRNAPPFKKNIELFVLLVVFFAGICNELK